MNDIFASYNMVKPPENFSLNMYEPDEDELFYFNNGESVKEVEVPFIDLVEVVNKPTLQTTYNDSKLDIEDLLKAEGLTSINGKQIKFGNRNLRAANASYGSKNSHHKRRDLATGFASARDISILGGTDDDYTEFRRKLLSNLRIVNYMKNKNWGIINELTSEILSKTKGTGRHFHFGPDLWATRTWNAWLNNPNLKITQYIS